MKNVFKKLFSLMLVAVMLVSVLPVTALADETGLVQVDYFVGDTQIGTTYQQEAPADKYGPKVPAENVPKMDAEGVDWWAKTAKVDMSMYELDHIADPVNIVGIWVYSVYLNPVTPKVRVDFINSADDKLIASTGVRDAMDDSFLPNADASKIAMDKAGADYWMGPDGVGLDASKYEALSDSLNVVPTLEGKVWVYTVKLTAKDGGSEGGEGGDITDPEPPKPGVEYTITFKTYDATLDKWVEYATKQTKGGELKEIPSEPDKKDYEFKGWRPETNGNGKDAYVGQKFTSDATFYAYYVYSPAQGNASTLSVYAKRYVDGVAKTPVLLYTVDLPNGSNYFNWLFENKNKTRDAVKDKMENCTWKDEHYYSNTTGEKLYEPDMVMNGDKSVVIKVHSKNEADVLLYVHKKLSDAGTLYEMRGFEKGDTITRDDVMTEVKKHYKNVKLDGLYTHDAWTQKKDDKKPSAANTVTVKENGTTKIHVILTSGSSTADSSNPKTGDNIFMTMTVMTLSATALAGAYIFNKKRMAK